MTDRRGGPPESEVYARRCTADVGEQDLPEILNRKWMEPGHNDEPASLEMNLRIESDE